MSAMSVLDLVKCHDASMLLGAFNMHCMQEVGDEDGEIRDLFFAPGTKRLELLRWVLIAIDPSGKHAQALLPSANRRLSGSCSWGRQISFRIPPEDESSGFSTASWSTAMTFKPTVASTPMPQVEQAGASSSNVKHEGTAARCLWQTDDLSEAGEKREAETEYLDNLFSKERLAALEASQEPEEPPLNMALCEYYGQTVKHLMKARKAMLEMPPPSVPPVVLDEEGEKLIAKAKEYLEDFRTQVCCTTMLKALAGSAEAHKPRGTARERLVERTFRAEGMGKLSRRPNKE
ncbi:hypothetical protein MRX96_045015 [Rhipicephalus microplus]